jgi:hypothetical protein
MEKLNIEIVSQGTLDNITVESTILSQIIATHKRNKGIFHIRESFNRYKVSPWCNSLKVLQYTKKCCNRKNCNTKIWLGGVATDAIAIGLCNTLFWCCNRFSSIATQWSILTTPWSVASHSTSNHRRCCQKYLLQHTQRVAIGTLATTMGVAIDPIATHQ